MNSAPRRNPAMTVLLSLLPLLLAAVGFAYLRWSQPDDLALAPAPGTSAQTEPGDKKPKQQTVSDDVREVVKKSWELTKPAEATKGFVGSAACRDCHAAIYEQYQQTSMAKSFGLISEVAPLEQSAPKAFQHEIREYRVEQVDGKTMHCESISDDESRIYDQQVEMMFAMGSGHKGRSYIFNRDGLLFMSPISWYAETNRFDLSPGYHPENGDRFDRRITSRCLSCHTGQVAISDGQLDRLAEPLFQELSIGCERCHGPGEQHVAFRQGDKTSLAKDPIINPAKLAPENREAVCNQCHLLGADEILRYGRTDFDFRPGMHLADVWTLFLEADTVREDGTPRAVSQAEQMRASRCFRLSDGKLGCISCHDPHSSPAAENKVEFYRNKCQECHQDRGCVLPESDRQTKNNSCVACHMPPSDGNDIPHVSQTQHAILRFIDQSGKKADRGQRKQGETYNDGPPLSVADQQRARGIAAAIKAERTQNEELAGSAITLLEPVVAVNIDDIAAVAAIARCYALIGKHQDAGPLWREVLMLDPKNEEALLTMSQSLHRSGQYKESLQFLDEFLQYNEWPAHAQGLRAQLRARLNDLDGAMESAHIALERDPTRATAYIWLEMTARKNGDEEAADRYKRLRERLEKRLPSVEPTTKKDRQKSIPDQVGGGRTRE